MGKASQAGVLQKLMTWVVGSSEIAGTIWVLNKNSSQFFMHRQSEVNTRRGAQTDYTYTFLMKINIVSPLWWMEWRPSECVHSRQILWHSWEGYISDCRHEDGNIELALHSGRIILNDYAVFIRGGRPFRIFYCSIEYNVRWQVVFGRKIAPVL